LDWGPEVREALLKDAVLLGAALLTAAESLRAVRGPGRRNRQPGVAVPA